MGTLATSRAVMSVRLQSDFSHIYYLFISSLYSVSSHISHISHNKNRIAGEINKFVLLLPASLFVGDQNAMTVMTVMTVIDSQCFIKKCPMTENPDCNPCPMT